MTKPTILIQIKAPVGVAIYNICIFKSIVGFISTKIAFFVLMCCKTQYHSCQLHEIPIINNGMNIRPCINYSFEVLNSAFFSSQHDFIFWKKKKGVYFLLAFIRINIVQHQIRWQF